MKEGRIIGSTVDTPFSARRSVMKNNIQILMKNGGGFELTTLMTIEEIRNELGAAKEENRFAIIQTQTAAGPATCDLNPHEMAAIVHAPTGHSVTVEGGRVQ
jgi:hypothetical protein